MTFLFSGGFGVLEVVRQKGDADLGAEYQHVLRVYSGGAFDVRGAVCRGRSEALAMLPAMALIAVRIATHQLAPFPAHTSALEEQHKRVYSLIPAAASWRPLWANRLLDPTCIHWALSFGRPGACRQASA